MFGHNLLIIMIFFTVLHCSHKVNNSLFYQDNFIPTLVKGLFSPLKMTLSLTLEWHRSIDLCTWIKIMGVDYIIESIK